MRPRISRYVDRRRTGYSAGVSTGRPGGPAAPIDRWRDEAVGRTGRLRADHRRGRDRQERRWPTWRWTGGRLAGFAHRPDSCRRRPGAPSLWPWQRLGRSSAQTCAAARPVLRPSSRRGPAVRCVRSDQRAPGQCWQQTVRTGCPAGRRCTGPTARRCGCCATSPPISAAARLLLIATARQSGGQAWDDQSASELMRASATRVITLAGLSTADVRTVAAAPSGWPDGCRMPIGSPQSSGGNPFYIRLLTSMSASSGSLVRAARPDVVRGGRRPAATAVGCRPRARPDHCCGRGFGVGAAARRRLSGRSETAIAAALAGPRAAEILRGADACRVRARAGPRCGRGRSDSSPTRTPACRHRRTLEGFDQPLLFGSIAEHWRQVGGQMPRTHYVTAAQRAASVAPNPLRPGASRGVSALGAGSARRTRSCRRRPCRARRWSWPPCCSRPVISAGRSRPVGSRPISPSLRAARTWSRDAALVVHGSGDWDAARVVVDTVRASVAAAARVGRASAGRRLLAQLSAALTETVDPVRGAALSRRGAADGRGDR